MDPISLLFKKVKNSGYKQRFLADKLGVSDATMTSILQGKRTLKAEEYLTLIKIINVKECDLIEEAKYEEHNVQ